MYSPIKPPDYFRLIKDAIDANILCYDNKGSDLSSKLIALTKDLAIKNNISPDTLYLPYTGRWDLAGIIHRDDATEFMGMKLRYITGLGVGDPHTKYLDYFYYLGGSLARGYDYKPHPKKYKEVLEMIMHFEWDNYKTIKHYNRISEKINEMHWGHDKESLIMVGNEEKVMLGCY